MSSIKKYILEQVAKRGISQEDAKKMLGELAQAAKQDNAVQEIAIIGMAGRFPRADNAEAYWQVLRDGLNCIRDFPLQRQKDFEHILRNKHYTEFLIGDYVRPEDVPHAHAQAGYLDEIDKFDTQFFGIPPLEALYMDPHQRMALELAWEAMEDAGYGGQRLFGSNTGLYMGKEGTNYSLYRYTTVNNPMKLTGSWESIMVSRISYLFNLKGPCMLVDTACSAGLVSIHMAAQAILNGECEMALAGGINLSITGEFNPRFQGSMAMDAVESKDATIRTFDARANGTVWGEGVAMVLLKPLSKALADGDPIHAIIKGSAINNDGAASGLTAPDAEAQEQVILKAWQKARIEPSSLSYIEAHGTGTVLGDPIEFKGLTAAFRRFTKQRQFCAIGSLKTNMGHLVAASGVASLFKVVKSLEHKEMAPTINFGQPNPYINFLSSPLYVNDVLRPWTSDGAPRRAALSSFGFSHTNCHMVLEEAPTRPALPAHRAAYCLSLSGQTREVLRHYVTRLQAFATGDQWQLADLCYTYNTGRGHYGHRLAIVAENAAQLRQQLLLAAQLIEDGEKAKPVPGIWYQQHQVVSEKKKQLEVGELSDRRKKEMSAEATEKVAQIATTEGAAYIAALAQLAQLYVAGAELDWQQLYQGERRYRLAAPSYPLQRIRVWAEPKISKIKSFESRIHPLIEQRIVSNEQEDVFSSVFQEESHWVLADHKIKGTCVVPGTTYLEMARVAARNSAHAAATWECLELRDVFFLIPMVVEPGQVRDVQVRLGKEANLLRFTIESSLQGANDWQSHVEGKILPCEASQGTALAALDIASLQAQATETIENFQAETDTGVFQFGPHWDAIRSAWRLGDDALAKLALQPALASELAVFQLHPSVLDNAMNLISQSTGATYLPFSYKSFKMFAPFCSPLYSHVVAKGQKGGETLSYDVLLCDEAGRAIAQITDYVVKKVRSFAGLGGSNSGADGQYLAMRWRAQEVLENATQIQQHNQPLSSTPRLLILNADLHTEQASLLSAALVAQGCRSQCINLLAPAMSANPASPANMSLEASSSAFAQFAASDMLAECDGIVFVCDSSEAIDQAAHFLRQRQVGVDALFHLCRALVGAKRKLSWGLAIVSNNAYAEQQANNPLAAACAMLGAVIGMEHSNLPCRLLDIDQQTSGAQVATQLLAMPAGRQHLMRAGVGMVREMYALPLPALDAPTEQNLVRSDAAYLITGGLGGLGLACAEFLAAQAQLETGAKAKLVLMGRSPLAARHEWPALAEKDRRYAKLLALAEQCAALEYIACDIADLSQLQAALANVRQQHGALAGIFHLAGVAGDGYLIRKEFANFDTVLLPKLQGLRNLYEASSSDALDYLVCFSSITALTGADGQGDYAAANACMDVFAQYARSKGRNWVSINWPSWLEIGMAADYAVDQSQSPFAALSPADGFARLQRILQHTMQAKLTQILPSTIQAAAMLPVASMLPFALAPEIERQLAQAGQANQASPAGGAAGGAANAINAEDITVQISGKNEEDLTPNEIMLSKIYAAVLGLAEIEVFTNFHDMGGNSIIATHLLKLIEQYYPEMVDISDIFSYSSIDEMAAYVSEKQERLGIKQASKEGSAGSSAATELAQPAKDAQDDLAALLDNALAAEDGLDSFLDKF